MKDRDSRYPEDRSWTRDPDATAGLPTRRDFLKGTCALIGASAVGGCDRKESGKTKSSEPARPTRPSARPAADAKAREKGRKPDARKARPRERGVAGKGQVFLVTHETALDKRGRAAAEPMNKVLDHLVREVTGKSKVEDGWSTLFKPTDIVAVKPNAFAQDWCAPAVELVRAVIERLHRIGVPHKNILIWDHWNFAGSSLYRTFRNGPAVMKRQKEWGFDRKLYRLPTAGWTKFNRAITKATAIVNMPVFKDHDLAGVTCSMKNMSHGSTINPAHHHKNCCSPSIPEIYSLPMIKDKVRLIITDASRVIYQGGPFGARSRSFNVRNHTWLAGTDPVAMDKIAWETVDRIRASKGKAPLMKRRHMKGKPRGSGRPIHVLKAEELGLGTADSSKIKVYKKRMG